MRVTCQGGFLLVALLAAASLQHVAAIRELDAAGGGDGSGGAFQQGAARRLHAARKRSPKPAGLYKKPQPRTNGVVKPTVANACRSPLRNVKVEYTDHAGARVTGKHPRNVAPSKAGSLAFRAAWPSDGVLTGRVAGGGDFRLPFAIDANGQLTWPDGFAVSGTACGGPTAAERTGSATVLQRAAAAEGLYAVAANGAATMPADGPATAAAGGATAAAAAPVSLGTASADDAVSAAAVSPAGIIGSINPNLVVNPDYGNTTLSTPVDIYILQNDNLPVPKRDRVFLFQSEDARGFIELLSVFEDTNAGEQGEDLYATGDGSSWGWVYGGGEDEANPNVPDFLANSYLTYTPPLNVLTGRVVFSYTVWQTPVGGSRVTQVVNVTVDILRQPGDALQASNDYFVLTPDEVTEDEAVDLAAFANDGGPTGLTPNFKTTPTDKSYLTLVSYTNGSHGIVTYDVTNNAFKYVKTDSNFKCGTDSFSYTINDPAWPARFPATATAFVTVLGEDEGEDTVSAPDFEKDGISRTQPYAVSLGKLGALTCSGGAKIASITQIDPSLGRVNIAGSAMAWYPPSGGLEPGEDEISWQYTVGFDYRASKGEDETGFTVEKATATGTVTLNLVSDTCGEYYRIQKGDTCTKVCRNAPTPIVAPLRCIPTLQTLNPGLRCTRKLTVGSRLCTLAAKRRKLMEMMTADGGSLADGIDFDAHEGPEPSERRWRGGGAAGEGQGTRRLVASGGGGGDGRGGGADGAA